MTAARRTAIVTGASRGIGRAIARRLARAHDIIAIARSEGELRALAEEIAADGGRCRPLPLDITDAAAVQRALADVEAGILVNNAGVGHIKPLLDLTVEEWREMASVNFDALFYVTRAVLPGMIRGGGGDIINIGSLAGRNSFPGGTGYAGTKHAVIAFTESLMLEVRDRNVRVAVVMPGSVATGLRTGAPLLGKTDDTSWMLTPEEIAESVAFMLEQPGNALVSRIEIRPSVAKR
ncbi:MAG TPA: SDR family NAD(P)-dependent oxidoreductase [Gemmatimonadaceae bacterium]|nr:SDR family NAD(P)-dependent oxidoreductase [Gemmatimonadaceae bacterium]